MKQQVGEGIYPWLDVNMARGAGWVEYGALTQPVEWRVSDKPVETVRPIAVYAHTSPIIHASPAVSAPASAPIQQRLIGNIAKNVNKDKKAWHHCDNS